MSVPVVVEVHDHERGVVEVQDRLKAISWSESVNPPWGGITLTLKPTRDNLRILRPSPGDWIVVRLAPGAPAVAWGRVKPKRTGLRTVAGGVTATDPLVVEAESWLAFLGRVQLFVGIGIFQTAGTLFSPADWESLFSFVNPSLRGIGGALEQFVRSVPRVLLPPSLGGRTKVADATIKGLLGLKNDPLVTMRGTLCHAIDVIHDYPSSIRLAGPPTAERRAHGIAPSASTRAAEAVPGPNIHAMQNVTGLPETMVLDLMMGTFGADPNLVELFPSLEDAGFAGGSPFGEIDVLGATGGGSGQIGSIAGRASLPVPPTIPATLANPTAEALGRNPVLVFRMRPWRAMPLLEYVGARLGRPVTWVDPTIFQDVTWRTGEAQEVPADDVTSVSFAVSDEEEINAATVGLPNDPSSGFRFQERAGLPILSPQNILRDGLRLYQAHWPFFKPVGAWSLTENVTGLQHMFNVAATAYQFTFNGSRFVSGTVTGRWRPDLRHGRMVHIGLPPDLADDTRSGAGMYAYAETVTHRIEAVAGGRITKRTDVTFTRGLFDDEEERFRTLSGLNDGDAVERAAGATP